MNMMISSMRKVASLFLLVLVVLSTSNGEVIHSDSETSVEFQFKLNGESFEHDRENGIEDLYDWLDMYLEDEADDSSRDSSEDSSRDSSEDSSRDSSDHSSRDSLFPEVKLRKSTAKDYGRTVAFFSLDDEKNYNCVKYRKTFSGDKQQHDLIWKIRDVKPGMDSTWFEAADEFQNNYDWSYKIERNAYHCSTTSSVSESVDYSSYIKLSKDSEITIETVGDIDYFFPGFSAYYGLSSDVALQMDEVTEYVSDIEVKIGESEDVGKITVQLRYSSEEDYDDEESAADIELSLKMKRDKTDNWDNAYSDMDLISADLSANCPYVRQQCS